MAEPLFSFLTTAFRTEHYVEETINSVLAQTRGDWELVVVDNGNSDEMASLVDRYTCDPRVRLVRQENKGMCGGVTAAADVSTGRYLCPLDSDDALQPNFCERMAEVIEATPGIAAVGCDAERFRDADDGKDPGTYFESIGRRTAPDPSRVVTLDEMLDQGVPAYIGVFRREIWESHKGYDPAATETEPDVALWLSLAAAGHDVRVLPDRLARVRIQPTSLSRDPSRIAAFETRIQRTFLAVSEYSTLSAAEVSRSRMVRRLRHFQAMREARWALFDGDARGARARAKAAYRYQPSLRCAAVRLALRVSPRAIRSLHQFRSRPQKVPLRTRQSLAGWVAQ